MKTIRLFGDLQAFKKEWSLNIITPAEAVRAIEANRPGFIQAADEGEYVLVLIDPENPETARSVTFETATVPWGGEELWVIPRVNGELPVAVVAAALATVGVTSAIVVNIVTMIINLAISIALSMISSLISGNSNKYNSNNAEPYESKPSYLFNGAINTTKQGHPIPLLYGGPMKVGSMTLSADLYSKDIPV